MLRTRDLQEYVQNEYRISRRGAEETHLIEEFGNRNFETGEGWQAASPEERQEYCLVFALFGTRTDPPEPAPFHVVLKLTVVTYVNLNEYNTCTVHVQYSTSIYSLTCSHVGATRSRRARRPEAADGRTRGLPCDVRARVRLPRSGSRSAAPLDADGARRRAGAGRARGRRRGGVLRLLLSALAVARFSAPAGRRDRNALT